MLDLGINSDILDEKSLQEFSNDTKSPQMAKLRFEYHIQNVSKLKEELSEHEAWLITHFQSQFQYVSGISGKFLSKVIKPPGTMFDKNMLSNQGITFHKYKNILLKKQHLKLIEKKSESRRFTNLHSAKPKRRRIKSFVSIENPKFSRRTGFQKLFSKFNKTKVPRYLENDGNWIIIKALVAMAISQMM